MPQYIDYELWREDLFGQSPDTAPVDVELMPETNNLPVRITLDYIDRSLTDPEIHDLFTREQIAIGLQQFYCNSCSNIPFCYIEGSDEGRRVTAIQRMKYLYSNYFVRYCTSPVSDVGNDLGDGTFGYLCYMLWDIFVVCPGDSTDPMIAAAVGVMDAALKSANDQCIVSALHGLGHWVPDVPAARRAIHGWLRSPTTNNRAVINYAQEAKNGCIQ